mgnify:CR=1 FL=1
MLGHKQYLSMKTFRVERDNASIKHELEEIKVVSDEVLRAKVIFFFLRREVNVSVFELWDLFFFSYQRSI